MAATVWGHPRRRLPSWESRGPTWAPGATNGEQLLRMPQELSRSPV